MYDNVTLVKDDIIVALDSQKKFVSLVYFFFCKEKRKLFVNKRCQASSRTSAAICTSESV